MPQVRIQIPGGQVKTVGLRRSGRETSLAGALEAHGIQLNMRCGGRGLCNGCKVELISSGKTETFRACQCEMESLPSTIDWIRIPENSWRDHSLHGVSVFEIHTRQDFAKIREDGYGVALDIGTTTLAGALWDFSTGACLSHMSLPNPQSRYGDNVLSRIQFTVENDAGSGALQAILMKDGLLTLVRKLCQAAAIQQRQLACATVSGNPTMMHTLLGESLAGFARYPFKPGFLEERRVNSRDIGFFNEFELQLLPSLGPFVGADIVAGAAASGMLESDDTVLLIDFGTNGEILLKKGRRWFATATAAGPAFEGGRLNCGAIARNGVISSIQWRNTAWEWLLSGTHEGDPVGISGAAYVDFLAAGAANGLLDHFGRFNRSFPGVYHKCEGDERDWTMPITGSVFITESDLAELLQAKAAIGGGILTLMEAAGVAASDLDRVLVAGGFGYHLDPGSAMAVGLLPDVGIDRIEIIGNASLGGASLLLNSRVDDLLQPLLRTCEVIELNQMASFEDFFTDCLMIGRLDA